MNLGYCCINLSIGGTFKSVTMTWAKRNPSLVGRKITDCIRHNLTLLHKILIWNIENNVRLYRLSSSMLPLVDHPNYASFFDTHTPEFAACKDTVKRYIQWGGRLSLHPDQFCVISSNREDVRSTSIAHLDFHGSVLSALGIPESHDFPINIHVSNSSIGLETAARNTLESIGRMSYPASSRLVFENEDRGLWTVANLLEFFPDIPVTLDFHHDKINPSTYSMWHVTNSWQHSEALTHYSEGRKTTLDRAHSDYIADLPDYDGDIELEAKAKDLALLQIRKTVR
jgi:UV DNA damage endonuclease